MGLKPQFRIKANQRDITSTIVDRFRFIRLTDETGTTADTLEIGLADHVPGKPVKIPPTGAELDVSIGYDGSVRRMGTYICDEIELSGVPGQVVLRGRAAPFEASTGGRLDLQTQKSRSWKSGTTIGDMVRRIAGEHRLTPKVSDSLARIALPHTDQAAESDMNLLHRIAKRHDAIAKPAGGVLLFITRGDARSATGAALPRVTFTPKDGSDYRVLIATRESPGTVIAFYRTMSEAKRHQVTVGEGDPVKRLRLQYKDRHSAESAAVAELRRRARQERTLSYTFPGRPDVLAESIAVMRGFREGVDGEWLVTRAEHYIGPDGYRGTIEAEQPNESEAVSRVDDAPVEDIIQPSELIDD